MSAAGYSDDMPTRVGATISGKQVLAIMAIATLSSFLSMIDPLLLGALAVEGRITNSKIGVAATLELLSTGIVAAVAGAWLPPKRLPIILGLAVLVFALANLATMLVPSEAILAMRTVAGCCSGIFIWLLIGMFARSGTPARLNGYFLGMQGAISLAIALLFSSWVVPQAGADGGYIGLAIISAMMLLAVPFLPGAYTALVPTDTGEKIPVSKNGLFALLFAFISLAGLLAFWIYLPALAHQFGYAPWVIAVAVPAALALEIAGGFSAAAFASKIKFTHAVVGSTAVILVLAAVLSSRPAPYVFAGAVGLFGFLWMFICPFQLSLVIAADPTRRTAVYVSSIQLLGSGTGPVLASLAVTDADVRGALLMSAGLMVISLAVMQMAMRRQSLDVIKYHHWKG